MRKATVAGLKTAATKYMTLTSLSLANGGIIRIRMRVDTLRFRLGRYPLLA